jgi:hypothetical protein
MEQVVAGDNLNRAFKKVAANKGAWATNAC